MSRRGHCLDNAVAESFFHSLKTERVKKKIYKTRSEAKSDLFDYIEAFYNRVRLHSHLGQQSPHEFEENYKFVSWVSTDLGEDQNDYEIILDNEYLADAMRDLVLNKISENDFADILYSQYSSQNNLTDN